MRFGHIPTATYRLQMTADFTFDDAARIVPYLRGLGISDLYLSPLFAARSGSRHGYDGIDPQRISTALGGDAGFERLSAAVAAADMHILLDIVPNHLAASPENDWWVDILRHGRRSLYAPVFDIDWTPITSALRDRVLMPILGERFGIALEAGQLQLELTQRGLDLRYFDWTLPIRPESYASILPPDVPLPPFLAGCASGMEIVESRSPSGNTTQPESGSIDDTPITPNRFEDAARELWDTLENGPELRVLVDRRLADLNGTPGDPASFDALEALLREQHYQLAYWRSANEEINYRRFFDVNDLVGVQVEDRSVFELVHGKVRELLSAGLVTGLRVDHIDGLRNPLEYLERVQRLGPHAETGEDLFVLVEKILVGREELSADWPVAGTTGYEFLNAANGLFTDRHSAVALDQIYSRVAGDDEQFGEVVYREKSSVMRELLAAPLDQLTALLQQIGLHDRHGVDLTWHEQREALAELAAWFPIYRTYVTDHEATYTDRVWIETALGAASARRPELTDALRFAASVLALGNLETRTTSARQLQIELVARWQQFTGPVMAKGFEDTSLYIYTWLISFNAVGGEPEAIALSSEDVHRWIEHRAQRWPHAMNSSSTHDSKRSEDVNARINVLTEMTTEWAARLERWRGWNAPRKWRVEGEAVPGGAAELLLYQTLLGAWPLDGREALFIERVKAYAVKAAREAKRQTSWLSPNDEYEQALTHFIDAILDRADDNPFPEDFRDLLDTVAWFGALNSLGQLLLKIGAPGVPDFYQGAEAWNLTLVDPDNRMPVDYELLETRIATLQTTVPEDHLVEATSFLKNWRDGRIKLLLTQRGLAARARRQALFTHGSYLALDVGGDRQRHVFAFARRHAGDWAILAFPRLNARLCELCALPLDQPPLGESAWGATKVLFPADAPTHWINQLTGERFTLDRFGERLELPLARLFQAFPFALLTPTDTLH